MILDGLLFLTTLAILLGGFAGIKILETAGYPKEPAQILENVHFVAYIIITVEFAYDMVMKVTTIVIGGHE